MRTRAVHLIKTRLFFAIEYIFSHPKLDYLWLAILSLYIFFIWFKGTALYFGGDVIYPIIPTANIDRLLYSWTDNNGGIIESGMMYYFLWLFFFFADKLGVSFLTAERVYLYVNFILPGLGMYYLISVIYTKLYPNNRGKRIACWLSALFYMFCPAILNFMQIYFFYGVTPFILAFFIRTIDASDTKSKIKYSLLSSVFCFGLLLFLPAYQIHAFFLLMLVIYSLGYLIFNKRRKSELLKSWLIFGSVVILVNLGSTLPWLFMVLGRGGYEALAGSPIRWWYKDNAILFAMTNTLGLDQVDALYFSPGPIVYLAITLLTIAAFSALLLRPSALVAYFTLVSLVAIVFSVGANPPFGWVYSWIVEHVLLLRGFRAPQTFLPTFVALGYAVLIGITFSEICHRLPPRIFWKITDYLPQIGEKGFRYMVQGAIVAFAIALILTSGWPMVTGAYYNSEAYAWQHNQGFTIPQAYYELEPWFNSQDSTQNYRVLSFPFKYGTWQWTSWHPTYFPAILPWLVNKPVIFAAVGSREGTLSPLISPTYEALQNGEYEQATKLGGLLNTGYFVLDGYEDSGEIYLEPKSISSFALEFDGVDDYVEVLDSASLDVSRITIEAWIKITRSGYSYILWKDNAYLLYLYDWKASGGLHIAGQWHDIKGTTEVFTPPWSHVALTYDNNEMKLYLNGELEASIAINGSIDASDRPLEIGLCENYGTPIVHRFQGTIDEVRILNRALTGEEVKVTYERRRAELEDGVVALWHFDEGRGTITLDGSGNFNNGIVYDAQYIRGDIHSVAALHYERSFDKLEVLSIQDGYFFPRVYATSEVEPINGTIDPDLFNYLEDADFSTGKPVLFIQAQLSAQDWQFVSGLHLSGKSPQLVFEQVNPTRYMIHVENASESFFLTLSTQFNDHWKASIDGEEVNKHLMANGYANAWYIDKTGSFTVVLNNQVQTYYHIALMISGLTVAGCLCYLSDFLRKGGEKHDKNRRYHEGPDDEYPTWKPRRI